MVFEYGDPWARYLGFSRSLCSELHDIQVQCFRGQLLDRRC